MSFQFVDDVIPASTSGKKPEVNPFVDVIAKIAHKTKKVDGVMVPVAKSFLIDAPGTDEDIKNRAKILRQLGDCGKLVGDIDPKLYCTVRRTVEPAFNDNGALIPGKVKIVFWTIDRIEKSPRKKDDEPSTNPEDTPPA